MSASANGNREIRLTLAGGILVFLATFTAYCLTVAPTVSFWDCGEFVACSYTLGVAHPPGSPMFLLIGRLFSLVPIFDQVALRTNFISVIFSSLSAVLLYLIALKLLTRCRVQSWPKYVGALVAGLFLGFSNTFWANAVETEVYGLNMFLMLLSVHLTLVWMDHRQTAKGDRLLVLIAYLTLLSIGVHMTGFLVAPVLFLLIVWEDREKLKDFRLWISALIFAMIMFAFPTTLIFFSLLGWLAISIFGSAGTGHSKEWFFAAAIMVVAIVGVSNQLYIPIRSQQDPAIDENNPETFKKFSYFFERKQYGSESMVKRSFHRRGQLINQFGDHERMGFWRFFKEQYMTPTLWFVPVLLGLYGLYELIKRRPREGISLLLLLIICSAGLVWYMNFGDGTIPGERLEVRDRDYFFLPCFVFFSICLGLGAAGVTSLVRQKLSDLAETMARFASVAVGIIFLLLPALAIANNYNRNDRSGNWIPWDYAHNLLNSCDKDAIMFTNGDNDTFPLWFLQEVEGIRKDVRIVNLSLINTDWYIMQLKHKMNVPVTLEDKQILFTVKEIIQGQEVERPSEPYYDPVRKISHYVFPFPDPSTGKLVRVQDMMIEHIIRANNWKFPIYFSATVSVGNRIGLDRYLEVQGYAYKLVPEQGTNQADTALTYKKIMPEPEGEGKYRGLADEDVYKDENTVGLLINYPEKLIELAGFYQMAGDTAKTIYILDKSREAYPDYWRTYAVLQTIYDQQKKLDQKDRVVRQGTNRLELMTRKAPGVAEYFQYLGLFYQFNNEHALAIEYLKEAQKINASDPITYQSLLFSLMRQNRTREMRTLAEWWLKRNPGDQNTLNLLRQLGSGQPLVQ